MAVPAVTRVAHFALKLDPTIIQSRYEALQDMMISNFAASADELVSMESATRAILDDNGTVDTTLYPFYYAFSRQCYAITKRFAGTAANNAAQAYKDRWTTAGLTPALLIDIALNVHSLVVT